MEEIKGLLDWVAGKEIWYWITIAFALSIARGFLKTLFSPIITGFHEREKNKPVRHKRTKPTKKSFAKAKPTGKWAKYE